MIQENNVITDDYLNRSLLMLQKCCEYFMVKDNPAFLYGTCSFLTSFLCSWISCDPAAVWTGALLKRININRHSFSKRFGNENGVERVYSANDFRSFEQRRKRFCMTQNFDFAPNLSAVHNWSRHAHGKAFCS